MKEIILCKYGEISLKGANRAYFEKLLRELLKKRTAAFGAFRIYSLQSTVYIEPENEDSDVEGAYRAAKNTFGISAITRAVQTKKTTEAILETAKNQFMPYLEGAKTFKVEAKRSDKRFPLTSPEISAEVGGAILEASHGRLHVDVHHPDVCVRVEIRDLAAYLCAGPRARHRRYADRLQRQRAFAALRRHRQSGRRLHDGQARRQNRRDAL